MANNTELVAVGDLTVARNEISAIVTQLKKKCKTDVSKASSLKKVNTIDVGVIWDSTHKVTGVEFNEHVTELQSVLSRAASQLSQLWNSLIEVYTTINKLDADYLSKIDKSFDLINKNYEKIKANNRDIIKSQKEIEKHGKEIEELIDGHEIALQVLKKFKTKIDKLSHLEEIDKLLGRIDVEKTLIQMSEDISKTKETVANCGFAIENESKALRSHVTEVFHKALIAVCVKDSKVDIMQMDLISFQKQMKRWVWGLAFVAVVTLIMALIAIII